jgi:hypothetical protein
MWRCLSHRGVGHDPTSPADDRGHGVATSPLGHRTATLSRLAGSLVIFANRLNFSCLPRSGRGRSTWPGISAWQPVPSLSRWRPFGSSTPSPFAGSGPSRMTSPPAGSRTSFGFRVWRSPRGGGTVSRPPPVPRDGGRRAEGRRLPPAAQGASTPLSRRPAAEFWRGRNQGSQKVTRQGRRRRFPQTRPEFRHEAETAGASASVQLAP